MEFAAEALGITAPTPPTLQAGGADTGDYIDLLLRYDMAHGSPDLDLDLGSGFSLGTEKELSVTPGGGPDGALGAAKSVLESIATGSASSGLDRTSSEEVARADCTEGPTSPRRTIDHNDSSSSLPPPPGPATTPTAGDPLNSILSPLIAHPLASSGSELAANIPLAGNVPPAGCNEPPSVVPAVGGGQPASKEGSSLLSCFESLVPDLPQLLADYRITKEDEGADFPFDLDFDPSVFDVNEFVSRSQFGPRRSSISGGGSAISFLLSDSRAAEPTHLEMGQGSAVGVSSGKAAVCHGGELMTSSTPLVNPTSIAMQQQQQRMTNIAANAEEAMHRCTAALMLENHQRQEIWLPHQNHQFKTAPMMRPQSFTAGSHLQPNPATMPHSNSFTSLDQAVSVTRLHTEPGGTFSSSLMGRPFGSASGHLPNHIMGSVPHGPSFLRVSSNASNLVNHGKSGI